MCETTLLSAAVWTTAEKEGFTQVIFTHWVANMLRMPVDKGLPNHKDKHDTVTVKWCFLFHCVTVRKNVLNICVVAANYLVLSYILLYVDFLTIDLGNVIV